MIATYCPEDVKVWVNNFLIGGFISGDFLTTSGFGVTLRLHPASDNIEYLIDQFDKVCDVGVVSNIQKDTYAFKALDVSGEYRLIHWETKFNLQMPQVTFTFIKEK